jgi:hypothetical protein
VAPDLLDDPDEIEDSSPEYLLEFLARHRQSSQRPVRRFRRLDGRTRRIGVLVGILVATVLVGAGVLIWGGIVHLRSTSRTRSSTTSQKSRVATTTRRSRASAAPPHPVHTRKVGHRKKPPPPRPRVVRLRLTAVRNDSWVQIREGSSTGPVLFDGIVRMGESIRISGRRRLWARFGSLGNFDLTINGRAVQPAVNGTVDTVITGSTIRPLPVQSG